MKITSQGSRLASLGARISVEVTGGTPPEMRLRAPFYRRSFPVSRIAAISSGDDDGMNHGLINWFVTGRASSPGGVRINNGGKARVEIRTHDGLLYTIVVDDRQQAERLTRAVKDARTR